jgi:hypothetical protein
MGCKAWPLLPVEVAVGSPVVCKEIHSHSKTLVILVAKRIAILVLLLSILTEARTSRYSQ